MQGRAALRSAPWGAALLRLTAQRACDVRLAYGALAQLGERLLCKHQVIGSIPIGSTSLCRFAARLEAGRTTMRSARCAGMFAGAPTKISE